MSFNLEWQEQAIGLHKLNFSGARIASILGLSKTTVNDFIKRYKEAMASQRWPEAVPKIHDNSRILLISDMHIPYHHPDTIGFLQRLDDQYKPTRIICLGDELDKHAMSYHDHDPDLYSAGDELRRSREYIQELYELFPEMDILESNHGSLHLRKAQTHGISKEYIKSYNEILQVGEGWQWHMDLTIQLPNGQDVYFHHGKTSQAVKTSQLMGMNHVCGHYHESFGIQYWSNPKDLLWGMNIGCLIDDKAMAFAYNKVNSKRPIIGTGLIIDSVPILEAMPL